MTTNTPAPAMQDINAIIAKHFGDDTAGAVRAQITVNEVLSKLRSPAPAMQEAVLTDAEIREIQGTHLVTISSRDALIASVIVAGRAIEAAVLSKLRAPVADTLPLEKALYELVNKIDTGLDTGDLLQDARRASTVLDAIMTGGDLVACAYTFFKECGEDKWRERYERSLDFRIGWNACLDAIAEAQANRAALASAPVADERHAVDPCGYVAVKRSAVDWLKDKFPALTIKAGLCERIGGRLYTITRLMRDHDAALASAPVAGEAVAWLHEDGSDVWTDQKKRQVAAHNGAGGARLAECYNVPLVRCAAPQAPAGWRWTLHPAGLHPDVYAAAAAQEGAEDVRNAALEEAAAAMDDHCRAGREWIPGSLWDALSREAGARIRALKSTPAPTAAEGSEDDMLTIAYLAGAQAEKERAGDALLAKLLDDPLLRDLLGYIEDTGPADVWGAAQAWMAKRNAALAARKEAP
ncbi:hypothetical protein [Bordetella bronchiseptica]|uniref:hypothetical protein n=1 Tax=Bordetella bronchiseptica TaxID=518 RepID=UPI000461F0FB|nr:hypothetical protein [Bordetella bronchiseptica]KDC48042.1 hypothetical protein L509_4176 [Bordetella bronchiseptica M85/00/2]